MLVHDNDSGVASAISLILGREYRVLKSTELGATREILRREELDVFVTDLDLRGEVSGTDLVHEVRRLQPAIRPLFTSVHNAPHELSPELAAGGAVVLQKPFAPDVLREALRNRLGLNPKLRESFTGEQQPIGGGLRPISIISRHTGNLGLIQMEPERNDNMVANPRFRLRLKRSSKT